MADFEYDQIGKEVVKMTITFTPREFAAIERERSTRNIGDYVASCVNSDLEAIMKPEEIKAIAVLQVYGLIEPDRVGPSTITKEFPDFDEAYTWAVNEVAKAHGAHPDVLYIKNGHDRELYFIKSSQGPVNAVVWATPESA